MDKTAPVPVNTDEQLAARRAAEVQRLKAAYDRGMASGEPVEIDRVTFLAELNAKWVR